MMNILEMIRENGMTLVDGNQGTKLLTSKEIVLNSIDREIKLIENRQHLNLLKVKSGNKQVDEKRMFIRDNEDSNNIKITIRVNGKILLREMINKKNKPKYITTKNDINSVIKTLNTLKDFISRLENDNNFFEPINNRKSTK